MRPAHAPRAALALWARLVAATGLLLPLAILALLGSACGASAPKAGPVVEHGGTLSLVRKSSGRGPDVAVLRRPLGELAWVSLWLDAGSRDATPAQVATLAAWQAAASGGPRVGAHVEPEGTELALACPRRELPRCLGELARALATRLAPEPALKASLTRLADARRAADAQDAGRAADRLALAALWGEHAATLEPLGAASADRAVARAGVETFLAAHYGARRALLIVVADLDERTVVSAAERAFGANPVATQRRVESRPTPDGSGVEVDVGAAPQLTIALAAGSPEAAHATAAAFVARAEQEGAAKRAALRIVRLRGQALAVARLRPLDAERATGLFARELAHARSGALPETPHSPSQPTPLALARQLGARWAAQSGVPSEPTLELGVGVVVQGGRADRLASADPDEPLRERARERLAAAFDQGLTSEPPALAEGAALGESSVTLENGAHLELRESRGDQLALAVRWTRGGLPEPATQHGQGALLSLLSATACAGLDASALQARLAALGARIEPLIDAGGYGIVLTASLPRWAEALDLGLSCALRPGLEHRHLSVARLRLLARLGGEGGPGELRAAVAELIAPAAPAQVAPWGSPARQASVSLTDLRALHAQSARAAALRVAVVAPIARDALLAAAVRRLSGLVDATPSAARKPPAEPPARTALAHDERAELPQPTLALAVWRAAGSGSGSGSEPAGALAFAALAHASLGQLPGLTVTWHDAGQNGAEAWAAVALTGPPEALAGAEAAVTALGAALDPASLRKAADAASTELTERAAQNAATPAAQAAALVADTAPPAPAAADASAARALVLLLARAKPTFLPLR